MCAVTSRAFSRMVDALIIGCSRLAVENKSQLEFRHMIHQEMKTKQKKIHDCTPTHGNLSKLPQRAREKTAAL